MRPHDPTAGYAGRNRRRLLRQRRGEFPHRLPVIPPPPLAADAEQIANEIGVMPLVQRLQALSSACNQTSPMAFEELALHQHISDAVAIASLDVDSVVAEIDYERAQTSEIRNVIAPNMLASLFGRKPELRSIYPQDVWAFVNTAPAADPLCTFPGAKN